MPDDELIGGTKVIASPATLPRILLSNGRAFWERHGTAVRIVGTCILLAIVATRATPAALVDDVRNIRWMPLILGVVLTYFAWFVNSYKWQHLLARAGEKFSLWELFGLNLIAIFYGLALPGQITGEVLKAIRVGRRTQTPTVAYASVWLDRLTGVVALAAVGCIGILLGPNSISATSSIPFVPIAVLGILVLATFALFLPSLVVAILQLGTHVSWSPLVRSLARKLESIFMNMKIAHRTSDLLMATSLACLVQASNVAANWAVTCAFGICVSPLHLAWIVSAVSLFQLLPVSISGLGVREAWYVASLGSYSIPADKALGVSLTMFALLALLGVTGAALDLVVPLGRREPQAAYHVEQAGAVHPGKER